MQFWWVQWKKGGQGESGATPGVAGEAAGRSAAHKTLSRARAWRVAHKKVLRNRTRVGWVLAMVATLCIRQHLADEIHTELRDAARCAEIHSCAFIFYSFAVSPAIYAQQGATTSPPWARQRWPVVGGFSLQWKALYLHWIASRPFRAGL